MNRHRPEEEEEQQGGLKGATTATWTPQSSGCHAILGAVAGAKKKTQSRAVPGAKKKNRARGGGSPPA